MTQQERWYVERSVDRFRKWLADHEWMLGDHDVRVAHSMAETAEKGSHVRIMKLFFEHVLLPQTQ